MVATELVELKFTPEERQQIKAAEYDLSESLRNHHAMRTVVLPERWSHHVIGLAHDFRKYLARMIAALGAAAWRLGSLESFREAFKLRVEDILRRVLANVDVRDKEHFDERGLTNFVDSRVADWMRKAEAELLPAWLAQTTSDVSGVVDDATRSRRLGMIRDSPAVKDLHGMEAIAKCLNTTATALYAMARGDRSKYGTHTLERVLRALAVPQDKW